MIEDKEKEEKNWVQKLSTPQIKVWASSQGTAMDKSNPVVKCEFLFKDILDPKQLFDSVPYLILTKMQYMKCKLRKKWDDGLAEHGEIERPLKHL